MLVVLFFRNFPRRSLTVSTLAYLNSTLILLCFGHTPSPHKGAPSFLLGRGLGGKMLQSPTNHLAVNTMCCSVVRHRIPWMTSRYSPQFNGSSVAPRRITTDPEFKIHFISGETEQRNLSHLAGARAATGILGTRISTTTKTFFVILSLSGAWNRVLYPHPQAQDCTDLFSASQLRELFYDKVAPCSNPGMAISFTWFVFLMIA